MLSVNPHPQQGMGGDGGSPFQWKYCRMCALELKQGVYIFGEEGRRLQIPEKIRKTVAILVLEEDTLPKKICTSCCNAIEQYLEFKASVQDAQEKLAAIAKSIEKSQEQSLLQLRSHSINQQHPNNMLPTPTKRPKLAPVSVISHSSSGNIISHSHHTPGPSSCSGAAPVMQQQAPSLIAGEVVEVDVEDPDPDPDPAIDCDDPPSSIESFNDNDEGDGASISREAEVQIQIQVQSSPPAHSTSSLSPKPSTSKQASSSTENVNVAVAVAAATEKEEDTDTAHLVCGICVTKIADKSSLEEHHAKDHKDEEVTYGCSACPRITANYEAIRQHIYRHRMAGTFKCADCDKAFPTKDQLHVHISSKHNPEGAKAFQCESCGNQYGSNIALQAHRRKVHCSEEDNSAEPGPSSKSPAKIADETTKDKEKEDGFWKCEICEKIFQSKYGYETHVATHKGRRYTCDQCGVSYTQKPTLEHHIRVHHTNLEREFECPECHKQFKTFRQLGWHKRTHEKPLTDIICPQCDKKFLNMISFKTHLKLHKGAKNHPCSECPKSFYSRQKLEEHMNSHTGRRPVGCPVDKCQKSFSCVSNYAKHFKKHHLDLVGPPGRMIPPPKMKEDNNNEPQKQYQAPASSSSAATFTSAENQSQTQSQPLIIPTLNTPPQAGYSSSMMNSSNESQTSSNSNSHLQTQTQPVLLQNPSRSSSGMLPPCSTVTNLNSSQAGVVTIPSFSTTSSQTQTQTSTYNFVPPPPPYNQSVSTSTSATTATSTQTLDNNVNVAHCNSSTSSASLSHQVGANLHVHTSPNSAQAHSSSSIQTQTLPSSHPHQFQMPSHSHSCPPPQAQTQSVWQPVMLPSSKNYHSSSNSTILLPSFEILDCAPLVPVPAHPSESHHQHQHQPSTTSTSTSSTSGTGPTLVPVSVVVAHNSTTSSQSHSSHAPTSGSGSTAHSSSSSHSHAIPVSSNCSVNVPHFVPSSQQSEPMELSYKLTDSNNFQDVPMELTKVFQRDPLELCVRQEFAHGQPLIDLSSRVVNVGGMSVNLNGNGANSSASGSSSGGQGGNSSQSQNAYPGALSGSNSNGMAYHKSVTEVIERELTLNDFTGAFRQPIDLIARSDDHPSSHELCSEGNLVDLSLRSSFGQDQSASSFLRELIDLSSRSDTFHGEINLTNKAQPQPPQSQSQISHQHQHPHQQHHPSSSSSSSHHHHHHQHPPPTHLLKSGGNNGHHHHHHHHHPPHHVQNQSHPSSNSSATTTTVTLQNVIYPELNFSNL